MKGSVIVLSGPSGAGKSTVVDAVTKVRDDLFFSVSVTTRERREGEVEGEDYYYISQELFDRMVEDGKLLEHAGFVGHSYGTPAKPVLDAIEGGKVVILDIEVQGAIQIKEKLPEAVTCYLTPSKFSELRRRLEKRATENEETIAKRIKQAKLDLEKLDAYEYIIINDSVQNAADELNAIINASLCRRENRASMIDTDI